MSILQRCLSSIVEDWLVRAKQSNELSGLALSDEERTGHLPKLVEDLVVRLSKPSATAKDSDAAFSEAALDDAPDQSGFDKMRQRQRAR
jgi:hypothetical protein